MWQQFRFELRYLLNLNLAHNCQPISEQLPSTPKEDVPYNIFPEETEEHFTPKEDISQHRVERQGR